MKTNRDLEITSSPACSPRYTFKVPAGAAVVHVGTNAGLTVPDGGYALDRPQDYGVNAHDAAHYWFWVPQNSVAT